MNKVEEAINYLEYELRNESNQSIVTVSRRNLEVILKELKAYRLCGSVRDFQKTINF